MKVRDIIKRLTKEGWELKTTRGSHRQFTHPTKHGKVTVSGHPSKDIPKPTLHSIEKQAGWR